MNKKVLLSLIVIVGCCLFAFYTLTNKKGKEEREENEPIVPTNPVEEKKLQMLVTKQDECTNDKKYYFEAEGKRYYLSCINSAWLVKEDKISFSSAVSSGIYSMDRIYSLFTKTENENYTLYKKDDASLIECKSGDVIIGDNNLTYQESFCNRTCKFTRTFYILSIEDMDKDNFKLTIMYDNEIETIVVKKSLNPKYVINGAYEFTFKKDELDKVNDTSAKSLFSLFVLDSVSKSKNKDGNFINESVCSIN